MQGFRYQLTSRANSTTVNVTLLLTCSRDISSCLFSTMPRIHNCSGVLLADVELGCAFHPAANRRSSSLVLGWKTLRTIAKTKILSRQFFNLYNKNSLFYRSKFLSRIFRKICKDAVQFIFLDGEMWCSLSLKVFPYCHERFFFKITEFRVKQ